MTSDYQKLEQRLLLVSWLADTFGYPSNGEMLADCVKAAEGYAADGRSHLVSRLLSGGALRIDPDLLIEHDANVHRHLDAINASRPDPILPRYFQLLSLLATEHYLYLYFKHRGDLLKQLNQHVRAKNSLRFNEREYPDYTANDLRKLAMWMATGSGKTLLFHLHYLQFLHHCNEKLDNILLITPNPDLTDQHLEEMAASGIPCGRFDLRESGLSLAKPNTVRVIEVTKLVDEKSGQGVSIPVSRFQGCNNLIFVDEGHKGTHGDVYRGYRNDLGETGFTFEYSATFGQSLNAVDRDELTDEYSRCILFDYSYKYFYGDGFGKDFKVFNLDKNEDEESVQRLLLANLLAFYEQMTVFHDHRKELRPYGVQRPLWLFVGHTVTGKAGTADLIIVTRFLRRFLTDAAWSVTLVEAFIKGTTNGLPVVGGEPFFAREIGRLKNQWKAKRQFAPLYKEILRVVFNSSSPGELELCTLKGVDDELVLRVEGAESPFGCVYIGKGTAKPFSVLAVNEAGVRVVEDAFAGSLFKGAKEDSSPVNVLIGARRFIEGWSSWRVSSLGLLNIGRAEGGQIIQLFGRGVRLLGWNRLLKRSSHVVRKDGEKHPEHLPLLERLLIFGVRSSYMGSFKDYLEREGVDPNGYWEFELPLWRNADFVKQGLIIPEVPDSREFMASASLILEADENLRVTHDAMPRLSQLASGAKGLEEYSASEEVTAMPIPTDLLPLLNWANLRTRLQEFRRGKGWHNLAIPEEVPSQILQQPNGKKAPLAGLIAPAEWLAPRSLADIARIENLAGRLLEKYTEKFYRSRQKRYESANMKAAVVAEDHANLCQPYIVQVPRSEDVLAKAVQALCNAGANEIWSEAEHLRNVWFDRHLYQPLLVQKGNEGVKITPAPLEPSAENFVRKLKEWWKKQAVKWQGQHKLFLLRNLSRGSGVGFYEEEGFFPDFILWIVSGAKQRIVFVEPHGLLMDSPASLKIDLWKRIADYTAAITQKKPGITFDAWIITPTGYEKLKHRYAGYGNKEGWKRSQFHDIHVAFDDDDYVPMLIPK
ncbi:MAG: DEAD/DEAH box helicase family protein [Verrucomicrobiota bacterium]